MFLGIALTLGLNVAAQSPWPAGKTALLLIDIQEFYFPGGLAELRDPDAAALNAGMLLDHFRAQGWPLVHIGHLSKSGQSFHKRVRPLEGEYVLMKEKVNAFTSGELQAYLQEKGITHLVICGMQTHMCVEAATRAAADLGYDCTLVPDACATRDLKYGDQVVPASMVHFSTLATLKGTYAKLLSAATLLEEMQRGRTE